MDAVNIYEGTVNKLFFDKYLYAHLAGLSAPLPQDIRIFGRHIVILDVPGET